ncbi:MAG: DUF4367 domain-containing protein [Clostridia bacterium]|nr:DUF4367 domain-containing protein [Clostridia bacterium]
MYNKSDKFDHLIALAAMKCAEEDAKELNELDTSSVKFDPSYYRKRAKMINGRKRRPALKRARTVTLRVAAAIMIISMLGCIMIGCVPEWREAIFGAIIEWYDNCFAVRFETPGGSEPETEPTDTNDGQPTAPTSIEEIRKPTDLPEGVREDILLQNLSTFVVDYYFNDEYLFSFSQRLLKPNYNHVDNEDVDVTYIKINGNDATVVEYVSKYEIIILWSDSEYFYYIASTECDLEELIEYAESVK